MSTVAIRDLRNHTADVIRVVARGEEVTLTNRGRPVARIVPIDPTPRKKYWTTEDFFAIPRMDPGMWEVLRDMGSDEQDWSEAR